jgi:hypothetical protein
MGWEAGCAPYPVWALWGKVFVPVGNVTMILLTTNLLVSRDKLRYWVAVFESL